jgi:hypothetical protein
LSVVSDELSARHGTCRRETREKLSIDRVPGGCAFRRAPAFSPLAEAAWRRMQLLPVFQVFQPQSKRWRRLSGGACPMCACATREIHRVPRPSGPLLCHGARSAQHPNQRNMMQTSDSYDDSPRQRITHMSFAARIAVDGQGMWGDCGYRVKAHTCYGTMPRDGAQPDAAGVLLGDGRAAQRMHARVHERSTKELCVFSGRQ